MAKKAAPKHVDRREFLKLATAAVGAAALPVSLSLSASEARMAPASVIQTQITDISNGLRGQNFNSGWKFNRGDVSGAQSPSFNDSAWRSLNVPHDWSIELAFNQSSAAGGGGGFLDGGVGWYRKSFALPASAAGNRVLIQFDGVYMNSEVWINGNSLGVRPYGYVTFEYDLTPFVNFSGTNVVAVRVNNNQPNSRWYSGSGIYRNVWLTVVNPVRVPFCGVFVSTPAVSSSSASVSVSTQVQNQSSASQSVAVITSIVNAGGTVVASNTTAASNIAANAQSTFSQSLTVANPQLWSVASPILYQVRTQVTIGGNVVDTYLSPLGIRSFQFNANTGFSLNGQSMKLRGVCLHHDLGALGSAINYRAIERQVQIMKGMGCNAIRTSHNPPSPELLDVCDRLGMLVMDEAFDCWTSGKTTNDYHLYFNTWAQTDIRGQVRRDRNHPSVIMWSIGNEINSPTLAIGQNLRDWVRLEDTTRPVTWASNQMSNATHQQIANILDLAGYNYGESRYDADHQAHPNWVIFGSETSSAVRSRGVYHTPVTQNILTHTDMQCSSYDNSVVSWGASAENSYKDDVNRNFVAGQFIWTGFDYIGEPTPYGWPAKSSYFGIVDTCGFPKDIYYFYKSRWTSDPMVHILPHWNWSAGQTITVFVYTNCDSVELFLNGSSLGSKSFQAGGALHLEWSVAYATGTLRAEGRRSGALVATEEVRTAGAAARVALSVDRATINADREDLAFLTADIVDANGVFMPTAGNTVSFSVSGPGQLVGVDNGNAISLESYKGTSRQAFSGKCLAIVQSTGAAGQIVVTASSSGLTSGSATITAQGPGVPTDTPTATPTITPTPGAGTNLALGKAASADSAQAANPASSGNDGSTTSRWCANDGNANHWWQVDLGAAFALSRSEVMWEFSGRIYRYRVEVSSNGSTWTTVVDKTANTSTAQTQSDPFSATARYVRITVTGLPTSPVTWASFYEFRVFGAGGPTATPTPTSTPTATPTATPTPGAGTNLALGKAASADSAETANPVASGNDGSTTSRWCANDGNTGHWWQVDLGAAFSLSGSEVMWEFSGRVYRYRVEVSSNGSTWTTVVDKTANTSTAQTQSDPFSATARYVRITVTGLPTSPVTWASFYEFRVFGS